MSKFDKTFIEQIFRIYAPEGSPLFEELRETTGYQLGLKEGLSQKHQKDAHKRLQNVNGGSKNDKK